MWSIQILWADVWVTVDRGFKSRGDAEWATARWKMANNCEGDPFRAFHDPDPWDDDGAAETFQAGLELLEGLHHDQRAEDEANYQRELGDQIRGVQNR